MAPEQVLTPVLTPELTPGTGAHDHDDEGYTGPATLTVDGTPVEVRVRVEARTEPHDGRVHWFGRVDRNEALSALLGGKAADVLVVTPRGRAQGRIGDVDLWERYRLTGVDAPPFPLDEPPAPGTD
ncbi:DUF4873 domain-containing protein [Pseudonocardia sp. RS11V-5]|uniref:DUF4873 domain-containing protein n=1 Tax=Pseudonocardia terrae TaxID=2905831 RepID=UPI001E30FD44|nr:DUF4873 domain-containing protein [Pseudonocardia terrae]MCE3553956.1 DUF4873 domain-containing protein [Pseudonocardia terrae]